MATTDDLDPAFKPAADWIVAVARYYLGGGTITSTRRGFLRQLTLYAQRAGAQACFPGSSAHERGLAMDFVVAQGAASPHQAWLGAVWNAYVINTWSPRDSVHFAAIKGCV